MGDEAPVRRWHLLLDLHADSLLDMSNVLHDLATQAEYGELLAERVSGGASSGYTLHLTHDPTMPPERYASELAAWIKRSRADRTEAE